MAARELRDGALFWNAPVLAETHRYGKGEDGFWRTGLVRVVGNRISRIDRRERRKLYVIWLG